MRKAVLCAILIFAFDLSPLTFHLCAQQWECVLYGGVGLPVLSSDNAPELRESLATALRGGYALGESWVLTGEVWQVRQFQLHDLDESLTVDSSFRVKRYQLLPFMLGVGYRLPLSSVVEGTCYASLGGYFRYIHCQKELTPQLMDDMGESGWGLAAKLSVEVMLWKRLGMQVWVMLMGNPFEEENAAIPGSKSDDFVFNRTHWHLEGYRQGFWGVMLGYRF